MKIKKMSFFRSVPLLLGLVFLTACSDDDDNNSAVVQTGLFLDAAVANIGYRTATQSGVTDANGNYNYLPGEEVTFFIGDISFPPVPAKGVVTPVDIAQAVDSSATIDSDTSLNIARILQSLDSDNDPSNGITIPDFSTPPSASIDVTASPLAFEAAFANEFPAETLVSASNAKDHLQREIDDQNGGGSGGGNSSQFCPTGETATSISTLPVGIASVVADLTVTFVGSTSPVALDSVANFTFSSSGILFVDNNEVSDAPYQCSGSTEVRWTNADNSLVYAASAQNDVLHEVNVFDNTETLLAQYEDLGSTNPASFNITGSISNADQVTGQWELRVGGVLAHDGSLATGSTVNFNANPVADGSSYEVTASNSDCTVTNGSGTVSGVDISNITISCTASTTTPSTFNISGTVSGLIGNMQIELLVGGSLANDLPGFTGSSFNFAGIADGSQYQIVVNSFSDTGVSCQITNGSGTVSGADITNVAIDCSSTTTPTTFSVNGVINNDDGVSGQWVVSGARGNDGGLASNSSVTFVSGLADGDSYTVTPHASPASACTVTNGSGTIAGADVTNVVIDCVEDTTVRHNISGTTSGVSAGDGFVKLVDSSGTEIAFLSSSSGANNFNFVGVPENSNYVLEFSNSAFTCQGNASASGTLTANVSDALLSCTANAIEPNGATSEGTVHASLVGDYILVYSQHSVGGPFTDAQEVSVSISASGGLTIDTASYDTPFNRDIGAGPHLPELIWLDSTANIEFALSDNQSGGFNEINVGDASSPTSSVGIPAFLGQLRVKPAEVTAADVVGIYEGSYSFEVTKGSGLGDTFVFTISADGTINYTLSGTNVELSPSEATYLFNDTRLNSGIEPGLEVSHRIPDETDGTYGNVKLFFEDQDVVAFNVGFGFTAELRPLPIEVTDMIAGLIAASPVALRVTKESSAYGGSFIPRGGLCQSVTLEMTDPVDTRSSSSELLVGFHSYKRLDWRYNLDATTGIQSLGRNSIQVDLHPNGEVSLGEGFIDRVTLLMSNPSDFATSVQSDIDAVCADYQLINISIQNNLSTAAVNGQVLVKNTDTGATLLTLPVSTFFGITAGITETFSVYLPTGTNFSVELANTSFPSDTVCSGTNTAAQVSTSNADVSFDCHQVAATIHVDLSGSINNEVSATGQWEVFVNGTFVNDGGLNTVPSLDFANDLVDGSTYEVRVSSNPTDACTVTNGTGTVNGGEVPAITISCLAN